MKPAKSKRGKKSKTVAKNLDSTASTAESGVKKLAIEKKLPKKAARKMSVIKPETLKWSFEAEHSRLGHGDASDDHLEQISTLTDWKLISKRELYSILKQQIDKEERKSEEEEICCICRCNFYEYENFSDDPEVHCDDLEDCETVRLNECPDHFFHKECVTGCYNPEGNCLRCPVCTRVYGILTGDQPTGTMTVTYSEVGICPLESYEDLATYSVNYTFPNGTRGDVSYTGTSRCGYLPDTEEGREVCELLKLGFQRGLVFTVGTSVTTGQTNTTVWNGVHHKTAPSGGTSSFGYPDPQYFNRVKNELAAKGVK